MSLNEKLINYEQLQKTTKRIKQYIDENKASTDDLTALQTQVDAIETNLATLTETVGMLDDILG